MLSSLPLVFSAPLVLAGLVALPVLWLLLRVTPPRPRAIAFPPLPLIKDLIPERATPKRTPPWLLLLRLLIAALVILAMAGPLWTRGTQENVGRGPLLVLFDNGWASGPDFATRVASAEAVLRQAARDGRPVALVATAEAQTDLSLADGDRAATQLRALTPQAFAADRRTHLPLLEKFLTQNRESEIIWFADALKNSDGEIFAEAVSQAIKQRSGRIVTHNHAGLTGLAGLDNGQNGLSVTVLRAAPGLSQDGIVRALDLRGASLAETRYAFEGNSLKTQATITLPVELRNDVARLAIDNARSAGAVALLDARDRRRIIGLVSGTTADTSLPLVAPTYYLSRAMAPYAEVREPRMGPADAINALIEQKASMIVLADTGALPEATRRALETYVTNGGVVLRFAGSRLASASDDFVPVKLRRGGRNFGGALSWDAPKTLAPFEASSPFAGLQPPSEVQISRQLLAEPEPDLAKKTWAALADGTPIVTAEKRGAGLVILFHVTADTSWSNLPLSGLFVDMLRRIAQLASTSTGASRESQSSETQFAAPWRTLDGYGALGLPPANARPVAVKGEPVASRDHPAGFYGDPDHPIAVNILPRDATLQMIALDQYGVPVVPLTQPAPVELGPPLLALALFGFILDGLAVLFLGGGLSLFARRRVATASASSIALILMALMLMAPTPLHAQTERGPIAPKAQEAAIATRLAYIITGDPAVDEASRAGLAGLSSFLAARTALEPAEPAGVDPAIDDLSVYPFLYWPIVAGRPVPPESTIRKLDAFMKGGGTVLFDTRDAQGQRAGQVTAETRILRQILAGIAVPELEPVPPDHVVTKAFYLIDAFPGRYADGQTWIEAIPRETISGDRPARAGDGVSPIIITSNDMASAWAIGRRGEPLYPVTQSMPRQREMAFRAGANIVMYALTGNYKADQVHVPALLERLGQ